MVDREQRRSARRLLGSTAEVHVGAATVIGVVQDVSRHGMGLVLPTGLDIKTGDVIWLLVEEVAAYAITGTVRRSHTNGLVGIELEEILEGDALRSIESLPFADNDATTDIE